MASWACASAYRSTAESSRPARARRAATGFTPASRSNNNDAVKRLWQLARHYWFDAVILAGIGGGVTRAGGHLPKPGGPQGPLWLAVPAPPLIFTPPFAPPPLPLRAPLASPVALG